MTLLVSYNLACKRDNSEFYEHADMLRLNSPWYTPQELEEILQDKQKPIFLDINLSERTKPKIFSHKYEDLLSLAGKHDVEWVGISNVDVSSIFYDIKKLLKNDRTKVCAKVETKDGCENIDSLIDTFDGIMVDVEDLATNLNSWSEAIKWKELIYKKCVDKKKDHFVLSGVIFEYKKMNLRSAYTYGAFDLLHPGHIKLLENAKSFCDYLIVGVVGDKAIAELKGKDRPIEPIADRIRKVSALKCVDLVIEQETYDPVPNLKQYKGVNILIKGNDWKNIPGEDFIKEKGGILIKPHYSEGWSTSGLVKKIRGEK
jgi:rfaE bifunctional protein nucleotidyltransferase chain/domain